MSGIYGSKWTKSKGEVWDQVCDVEKFCSKIVQQFILLKGAMLDQVFKIFDLFYHNSVFGMLLMPHNNIISTCRLNIRMINSTWHKPKQYQVASISTKIYQFQACSSIFLIKSLKPVALLLLFTCMRMQIQICRPHPSLQAAASCQCMTETQTFSETVNLDIYILIRANIECLTYFLHPTVPLWAG